MEKSDDPIQFHRQAGSADAAGRFQPATVTLVMSEANYMRMNGVLGLCLGSVEGGPANSHFWEILRFTNDLNAGNPNYTPYEIPVEHAG